MFQTYVVYVSKSDSSFDLIDFWNFLQKMRFVDILVIFRLDLGQTSFNPVENAFATHQLASLATSIAFYHIVTRACAEIKILRRDQSFWTRK